MSEKKESILVEDNLGLVHSCANKFRGRGVEYEDLFQAGCVGLVKAANGFDVERGFAFSTYAVPAIFGEIKRIFRDGGAVKVGRAAKEKARELIKIRDELAMKLMREPTISEISHESGMDEAETAQLLCASMPPISLTSGDEDERQNDIPVSSPDDLLNDTIALSSAISRLSLTERKLIHRRYFRGQTQTVVAEALGMSQVQVSRREKAILLKLRTLLV